MTYRVAEALAVTVVNSLPECAPAFIRLPGRSEMSG